MERRTPSHDALAEELGLEYLGTSPNDPASSFSVLPNGTNTGIYLTPGNVTPLPPPATATAALPPNILLTLADTAPYAAAAAQPYAVAAQP